MGLCGVLGEVQRPSGAGSAASPQAAKKGCIKRFLRWTGLSAGRFRGFCRCPYGRIIKKAPTGIYQPKRHREADSRQR